VSNYIKVHPKVSWARLICRTYRCFQRQRLPYTCGIKTKSYLRPQSKGYKKLLTTMKKSYY